MFELEDHHWWFVGRLMMTQGFLKKYALPRTGKRPRLLDIGCGTGRFLSERLHDCRALGIDLYRQPLELSRRRGLTQILQADAVRLPFRSETFDILTAFDLIEHLPDDRQFVAEARRVLRPGGFLIATVPAHPILWTGHDVSLHHRRRYRREAFQTLFPDDAWEPIRLTPAFFMIFGPALTIRLLRRLLAAGGPQRADTWAVPHCLNRLLIQVHRLEAAWLKRFDLPVGVSLLLLVRKRPE